jgi:hypothetical protein
MLSLLNFKMKNQLKLEIQNHLQRNAVRFPKTIKQSKICFEVYSENELWAI